MNKNFRDNLAQALGISPDEQKVLDVGGEHPFDCKCNTCKLWWQQCGPDEDGKYGPFTQEEMDARNG